MGNLVLGKAATASSSVLPYSPKKAVDGNVLPVNRWECNKLPGFLVVDMGATYWINRWVVKHMASVTGYPASNWYAPNYVMNTYKLQGSMDNISWFDIDGVSGNTAVATDRTFIAVQFRYVRLFVTKGLNSNQQLASCMELEVYEAPPTSPNLLGLTISQGTLSPTFTSGTLNYTATVGYDVSSMTVTPTSIDGGTIKVMGVSVASGVASSPISLSVGTNAIQIQVTSRIGGQIANYTLTVIKSANLYLEKVDLAYTGNRFTSSSSVIMDHMDLSYDDAVTSKATQVKVTPFAEEATVAININGQNVTSGSSSDAITLSGTATGINITVSYAGIAGSRDYVLTITES